MDEHPALHFGFDGFEQDLLRVSRRVFTEFQQAHVDEGVYALGFVSHTFDDVTMTANSEAALMREAARRQVDVEALRWKWNEWEYMGFCWDDAEWRALNARVRAPIEWVNRVVFHEHSLTLDEAFAPMADFQSEVAYRVRRVLKRLDAEGVFGVGATREQVVLGVFVIEWPIDEACIGDLNPPNVVQRVMRDLQC